MREIFLDTDHVGIDALEEWLGVAVSSIEVFLETTSRVMLIVL